MDLSLSLLDSMSSNVRSFISDEFFKLLVDVAIIKTCLTTEI
jgi:hypothetical protein